MKLCFLENILFFSSWYGEIRGAENLNLVKLGVVASLWIIAC